MHDAPLNKSVDLCAVLWASVSCYSSSTLLPKKPEKSSCSANSTFQSAVSFAWNSPSHSTAGSCSSFKAHPSRLCSATSLISLFPFSPRLVPPLLFCLHTLPMPFSPGGSAIIFPWEINFFPLSDHGVGMGLIPPLDSRLST